ncbi:peptidase M14, partial [bacterium]|nr:peptidase M14 [bacterium]
MLGQLADKTQLHFRTSQDVRQQIREACLENSDIADHLVIGASEKGQPIDAAVIGTGPKRVSLIAGSHSDEPVGPETLRTLILKGLSQRDRLE